MLGGGVGHLTDLLHMRLERGSDTGAQNIIYIYLNASTSAVWAVRHGSGRAVLNELAASNLGRQSTQRCRINIRTLLGHCVLTLLPTGVRTS